jgi:hypothetical protein
MRPQHTDPGRVASLVLSYQLRVLRYPERYATTNPLGVEARVPSAIKLENILDFKLNIEATGRR